MFPFFKKLFEVYRVSIQANQLEIVVYENSMYHNPDHSHSLVDSSAQVWNNCSVKDYIDY